MRDWRGGLIHTLCTFFHCRRSGLFCNDNAWRGDCTGQRRCTRGGHHLGLRRCVLVRPGTRPLLARLASQGCVRQCAIHRSLGATRAHTKLHRPSRRTQATPRYGPAPCTVGQSTSSPRYNPSAYAVLRDRQRHILNIQRVCVSASLPRDK